MGKERRRSLISKEDGERRSDTQTIVRRNMFRLLG